MAARKSTAPAAPAAPASRFARGDASPLPGTSGAGRPSAPLDQDLLDALADSFATGVKYSVPVAELAPPKDGETADAQIARAKSTVRRHVNSLDGVGVRYGVDPSAPTVLWFRAQTRIQGTGRKARNS